ncbi:MAG: SPFH domain-containing protein [Candidatus Thorarchaeota archaeon]|nr:MAG: SPFH domain-containing protein [Candidatus Thorarchaeota archaeon]
MSMFKTYRNATQLELDLVTGEFSMADAIEWTNAGPDQLVWRYPDNRIRWGSQLIVQENQAAIFYRDGKALDTFLAGRHKLTTSSMPSLVGWLQKKIKGDVFQATCIFISRSQFQGKYGGRGQTSDLAPLMFHGNFWFRVKEHKIFTNEVVGNQNAYSTKKINDYLRSFMNERIIDEFAHFDLQTVFTQLDETSLKVKTKVRMAFERLGLELVDLKFEGLDTTEKYRERLFWLKTGGVGGAQVMGSETMKSAAESLGKSPGAGFGAGMGFMGAMGATMGAKGGQGGGGSTPAGAKFCSGCGTKLEGAKFCPNCGQKVG